MGIREVGVIVVKCCIVVVDVVVVVVIGEVIDDDLGIDVDAVIADCVMMMGVVIKRWSGGRLEGVRCVFAVWW